MEQLIPKLRFPEFSGEWEKKRLKEIVVSLLSGVSVNSKDKPTLEKPAILKTSSVFQGVFYPFENKEILPEEISKSKLNPLKGTLLVSRMNTPLLVGECALVKKDYPNLFVPDRLWLVSLKANESSSAFVNYLLNTYKNSYVIKSRASGTSGSMKNISQIDWVNILLTFPSLPEQQKIADYLSTIDKKLELLREKREQLECYKKGMMQQLFSQQIRFKDDSGKNYPDWQEKRLGEILKNVASGKSLKNLNGLYTLYGSIGEIGKCSELLYRGEKILVARVGANAGYTYIVNGVYGVTDNTIILDINICFVNILYLLLLLKFYNLNRLSFGSGQPLITSVILKKLKINLPSLPEQQKIADFLSALDTKIEGVANQIEQTEAFKKAMLQQLFV